MGKQYKQAIYWIRRDLRVHDNPALREAVKSSESVLPVYIYDEPKKSRWRMGEASQWWLHYSLLELQEKYKNLGLKLVIRKGDATDVLKELIKDTKADFVVWNRCYEPESIRRDTKIKVDLIKSKVEVESFNGMLLFEPWKIKNKQGGPFKVYTAFWNHLIAGEAPPKPLSKPASGSSLTKGVKTLAVKELKLTPTIPWDGGMKEAWQPGRAGAQKELKRFLKEAITIYDKQRDFPEIQGTSRLSPHLHFGEISAREVWHAIQKNQKTTPYLRQIVWREFAHHLLFHFQDTPTEPLSIKFKKFPWKKNSKALKAWQKGQTGYPIVDAGMRELWHTGWMHNRVRMIAASFLVKDLTIPWQQGAGWFWDTLVDADLANNTMGWQWVAGCGADAAPFFRIFNPVRQGERFDSNGNYVKKWVPELEDLPKKWIHQPWNAPQEVLDEAGICLGKTYPQPMVDHEGARRAALKAYQELN